MAHTCNSAFGCKYRALEVTGPAMDSSMAGQNVRRQRNYV